MATIRTAIQIQDRLSQPMRAMHNAVSMMVNQMEAMNAASGHMMDTSSIETARRELARAADQFNRIENEIQDADNAQQRFTNHIRDGTNAAKGLLGKVMGIVAAYLTLQSIGDVVKLSDEITNIDARLNLAVESMPKVEPISTKIEVDTSGLTEVQQLQQQIFDAAQRSYAPYTQTADLVGKLSMNAKDAFGNTTEVVAFAELLNKQFGIAGTNAEGVASATLQLTQALGSGVLRGEELNSVFESAPTIIQNIADHLGVSIGQIRKMAADGELTASVVKNAMFAAADDINKKFNDMPVTWSQVWTNFKNEALWAFQDVLKNINGIFNSDRFKEFSASAKQSLYLVASVVEQVLTTMTTVGAFVYDNWSFIAPVVGGVTAALIINAAAWAWTNREIAINAFMTATAAIRNLWYVATTVLSTLATYGFTAAMAALSIAIAANPIGWLIGAIVVLISLFYLGVAAVNEFAGTSYSATGMIAGAFMVLGTVIYNVIAYIWNMWASYIEFFVNAKQHGIYAVKRLFGNLANNAIDMATSMIGSFDSAATNLANVFISGANMAIRAINWVIDALNKIPGIDIGKISEREVRTSVVADYSNLKKGINAWVGDTPEGYWEAPKMEMKSLSDAWSTGKNWGSDLFNNKSKIANADAISKAINDALALGDKLDKGNDAGKKTADNTKKAADGIKMLNEDLKYLRDIAEREAINRYTTAEIKVDARSENYINNEMDIDGVISLWGEKMEEAIEIVAEGGPADNV
ncbi:tape measure protein [Lysinibacillus parviboronicapiens]|uniref:tape measure protein n=1 Tax=Lysinibacillus parviboronicapiens TaxID=436516 RepID=UPI000D3BDF11|nr:tape measure protein [Lysinibacillus parviboronicapiens]